MLARTLRRLALVGVVGSLTLALGMSFPLAPRQGSGFLMLAILAPVALLAMAVSMPRGVRDLWRHPGLLVPLGLYLLAVALLDLLGTVPLLTAPLLNFPGLPLASFGLSLSVVFLIGVFLAVVHDTWQTLLIRETVGRGRCDPGAALLEVRRWFWRMAGLESLCWAMLLMIGGAIVATMSTPRPNMFLMTIGIVVFTLVLNLGTGALLLAALDPRLTYWGSVRQGVRRSWQTRSRWAGPMIVQLLLLGLLTFVAVSYDDPVEGHQQVTNFNVNGMWVGGYESECRWYGLLDKSLKTRPVPVVSEVFSLIFGVMAVAMKLTVAHGLVRPGAAAAEEARAAAGPSPPV